MAPGESARRADGLPVLDWQALEAWARGDGAPLVTDPQRIAAVEKGHRAWLPHLRQTLGSHLGLLDTEDASVLSSLSARQERATADYIRTARARISGLLGDLAVFPAGQRSLVS